MIMRASGMPKTEYGLKAAVYPAHDTQTHHELHNIGGNQT